MVKKWSGYGGVGFYIQFLVMVTCLMPSLASSNISPLTDITIRKEPGVCQSTDIRNSVKMLSQLRGCEVVEGFVQIVLIDQARESDYANISFPELKEITGYLLLYRVNGLRSLNTLFPSLAVIRGNTLFLNYALVVFEMLHLQEIGLKSLTDIVRGAIYFAKNPMLCFISTINWDLIATNGKEHHYIINNKPTMECPLCAVNQSCPTTNFKGESLNVCWNNHHCQKVCHANCGGSCSDKGECCHRNCLGSCTGPSSADCLSCRHFYFQKMCVENCPQNTYEYIGRRCVVESECYDMPKPREVDENVRNNPWIPFMGHCLLECPTGYSDVERNGKHVCESCQGICKKTCTGINIDSIASIQKLRGCTIIKGALEIQIRGGSNVVKELEENLNMVEEIYDFLKIVRSFPLVSLNFLKKLKVIHGIHLESSKYALVVLDNQNLVDLWDWNTRGEGLEIKNGRIFFHFNPKLCVSKIETLNMKAKLEFYTELEVASTSNGDKVACDIKLLTVIVYKKNSVAALIKWKQFDHHDSRTLLGYVVYSIEAPFQNVTMFDGRDACGGDRWRVEDVNVSDASDGSGAKKDDLNHILTRLKPYTQYAFYVRTYSIATENIGAQSPIQYFRTDPDAPTEPQFLMAYSNSSSELVVSWQPSLHANGRLSHYLVTSSWEKDREDFIEQRNYCLDPHPQPIIMSHMPTKSAKPIRREPDELDELSLNSCPCKKKVVDDEQREKEIYFEDHLQNQIYVKRTNTNRVKRDLTEDVETSFEAILPESRSDENSSHSFIDGIHFSQVLNSTSLVMRGLRHFGVYNIAVRACRRFEHGENYTKNNTCSEEAIVSARTLPMASADNLESIYPIWEIHNDSAGDVLLSWNEPLNPNSLIVAYQIEYMRLDYGKGKYSATIECITRKEFVDAGRSYILKNLAPGNYSLRLRATSLYGTGNFTPYKYFVIKEAGQMSMGLFLILLAFPILFIIAFFVLMTVYYVKKQYNRFPSGKLIVAVNPAYVPTAYVADGWEVPRQRVELLREIGQGTFGSVHEGFLHNPAGPPHQLCAVKAVNDQASEKERIEFLNEASVMKAFSTHHVVKLLGVVSLSQPTLVVMELMKHGDLKSFLRSHRPDGTVSSLIHPHQFVPPTLKRIIRMAAEIADGMAYLAAKKFVHRDLAARNCMVADNLTVKIGDFGMTRDIYETDYYRKGSKGLLPVRWMAPESLQDGIFTSNSDAWSYGVVLYEMVTLASQPYQGLSNDQVLRYVIEGGTIARPENCPSKLYNVMAQCWENKPTNRPSFLNMVSLLLEDVEEDFEAVSFFHSQEGIEYRAAVSEITPLIVSREVENFSLSECEDNCRGEPSPSTTSRSTNGSNPHFSGYFRTTSC